MKNTFTTVVLHADVPTANGNIYPKKVLERMVETFKERTKNGDMFGVYGMPVSSVVNLHEISHRITRLEFDGNDLVCDTEIFMLTPQGRGIMNDMEKGELFTVRPAGMGSLKDGVVQDDYQLISLNIVKTSCAA